MVYLFDTNAVSDIMGANPMLHARMNGVQKGDQTVICPIVRGEVLFGINRLAPGKKRDFLSSTAQKFFGVLRCIPMPPAAGDHYSELKLQTRLAGVALNENDLWIAACALALGATLITRDQDFRRVAGLAVEDWTK